MWKCNKIIRCHRQEKWREGLSVTLAKRNNEQQWFIVCQRQHQDSKVECNTSHCYVSHDEKSAAQHFMTFSRSFSRTLVVIRKLWNMKISSSNTQWGKIMMMKVESCLSCLNSLSRSLICIIIPLSSLRKPRSWRWWMEPPTEVCEMETFFSFPAFFSRLNWVRVFFYTFVNMENSFLTSHCAMTKVVTSFRISFSRDERIWSGSSRNVQNSKCGRSGKLILHFHIIISSTPGRRCALKVSNDVEWNAWIGHQITMTNATAIKCFAALFSTLSLWVR